MGNSAPKMVGDGKKSFRVKAKTMAINTIQARLPYFDDSAGSVTPSPQAGLRAGVFDSVHPARRPHGACVHLSTIALECAVLTTGNLTPNSADSRIQRRAEDS